MILGAQRLPSETVAWAEDVAVELGFRRDAIEVIAADDGDPNDYCRFSACGNVFEAAGGHIVVVAEEE